MIFNDQSTINAHYDTAHSQSGGKRERPDARYKCDVCGRKFTKNVSLKRHLSTVHGVGGVTTFECGVCSKVYKRKGQLDEAPSSFSQDVVAAG